MSKFKFGKKAPRRLMSTPSLGNFLSKATEWPAVPAMGWEAKVADSDWGMLANDRYGNCLIGDAIVDAPDANTGYRSNYNGTVITFRTYSGKSLTVTPNHPMLTERGYVPAYSINHGDNLVSARGSEVLPRATGRTRKMNVDYRPAPIHEIFSSLGVAGIPPRKMSPMPVHFHGDGKYMNGDIEIVSANGFLGGKLNAPLRKPHSEYQVSPTGKLKAGLKSFSSAFESFFASGNSAFSGVGRVGYSGTFSYGHAGITQSQLLPISAQQNSRRSEGSLEANSSNLVFYTQESYRLARDVLSDSLRKVNFVIPNLIEKSHRVGLRTYRDAAFSESSSNSIAASTKDFSDFFARFTGLVHLDRIVDINAHSFTGHVFNLSTDEGWYSANGIITHNCAEAGIYHLVQAQSANTGNPMRGTTEQTLALYTAVTGFNPNDPDTDQGTALVDLLQHVKKNGLEMTDLTGKTVTVEVVGFASLDISSIPQMRYATYIFGGSYLGINCPQVCEDDLSNWNFGSGLPLAGGHCISRVGEGSAGGKIVSWGKVIPFSNQFWTYYGDEGFVILTKAWLNDKNQAPSGLDLDGLVAAMKSL